MVYPKIEQTDKFIFLRRSNLERNVRFGIHSDRLQVYEFESKYEK